MEWWVLLALLLATLTVGVVVRLRKSRRHAPDQETKNIYPLW